MRFKLHELHQGSSLEKYINDFDTLASHLELPEQQKIHYFIFGLKPKLKQALLIRQPQTYDDAVTFAKRKHHFADTDSDTQLMDLLQEIRKEVSLKHTGIKQEPYSNQHSQRASYRSHDNQRDPMGYPYTRDATYASPSRQPPFSSTDQTEIKNQARRTNIPGQHNNYSNVI